MVFLARHLYLGRRTAQLHLRHLELVHLASGGEKHYCHHHPIYIMIILSKSTLRSGRQSFVTLIVPTKLTSTCLSTLPRMEKYESDLRGKVFLLDPKFASQTHRTHTPDEMELMAAF